MTLLTIMALILAIPTYGLSLVVLLILYIGRKERLKDNIDRAKGIRELTESMGVDSTEHDWVVINAMPAVKATAEALQRKTKQSWNMCMALAIKEHSSSMPKLKERSVVSVLSEGDYNDKPASSNGEVNSQIVEPDATFNGVRVLSLAPQEQTFLFKVRKLDKFNNVVAAREYKLSEKGVVWAAELLRNSADYTWEKQRILDPDKLGTTQAPPYRLTADSNPLELSDDDIDSELLRLLNGSESTDDTYDPDKDDLDRDFR